MRRSRGKRRRKGDDRLRQLARMVDVAIDSFGLKLHRLAVHLD